MRLREQEAALFRVETHEKHRHKFYGRMGIYHDQITHGAYSSGNSNVLLLDPKYTTDLQTLYRDYIDEAQPGAMVTRSRATSFNSTAPGS